MKGIYNIALVLAAAITLSLSGCNPASVTDVTPDELPVVATADEVQTEPTTIIEETTVAETTVPETTAEVTEPTKAEEPEKTENKTSSNSSSSTSNKKPVSNGSNGSQTTNKPSNNTSSGSNSSGSSTNNKPAETKPKPVVVTDDTIIPYEQICTDTNMKKVTDSVNAYFINKGCSYDSTLNKDNSGWYFVQMPMLQYDELSVNKLKYMVADYFNGEVEANLLCEHKYSDGHTEYYYTPTVSDVDFNCYYELTSAGYYNIYFCHQ